MSMMGMAPGPVMDGYTQLRTMDSPRAAAAFGSMPVMTQQQFAAPQGGALSTFGQFSQNARNPNGTELKTVGGTPVDEEHTAHFDVHDRHPETGKVMIDAATGQAPRRCTDLACCFIFMLYAILCWTVLFSAYRHGNIGRLTHGVDYYGRTCGVDPGVENEPFLFWCRSDAGNTGIPAGIDLDRPSCVPYCPSFNATNFNAVTIPCLQENRHQGSTMNSQQFGNTKTLVFEMQESIVETAPYSTTPRGGRFCVPTDPTLRDLVLSDNRALGPFSHFRFLTMLGTLGHLGWLLFLSAVVSILLGYAFVHAIRHCPRTIAYPFTIPVAIVFTLTAFGFTFGFIPLINATSSVSQWYMRQNPFYSRWDIVMASVLSMISAFLLWVVSLCLIGMCVNFSQVQVADLLTCSTECVRVVPCMMYIPVFEALGKFAVFWCGLQGFRYIASEGWIEKNRIHVNGAEFAGLSRKFIPSTHDPRFYIMAIIWLAGWRWSLEIVQCFAQWLMCWCTFQWWRVKKDKGVKGPPPSGTLCEGVKNIVLYHWGSLIMAAMTIPSYRAVRFIYWCTLEIDPDQPPASCFGRTLHCMFCPIMSCIGSIKAWAKDIVQDTESPCKDGFNDVAIRSNDYVPGVEKAHALLEHSHKVIQFLYRDINRMTLNVMGVITISCITSAAVYLLVANLDIYKEPASELYVADPVLVTILTWLLSSYIAFGFMGLWDHVSDCLMYCYCWHRRWNRKTVNTYIPDSLRFIVGFDDTEHDRYPYYGRAKNNMYLRFWLPMVGMEGGGAKHKEPPKPEEPHHIGDVYTPGAHGHFISPGGQAYETFMKEQQEEVSGAHHNH